MKPSRIVLLAAEAGSLDECLGSAFPEAVPLVVVTWDPPGVAVMEQLPRVVVVVVGGGTAPPLERTLMAIGGRSVTQLLVKSSAGRLLHSFSPIHRSRLFAIRAGRRDDWHVRSGDALIALDQSAALYAWRAIRSTPGTTATLGLAPGLARVKRSLNEFDRPEGQRPDSLAR